MKEMFAALAFLFTATLTHAKNLHLIDSDPQTGFAIYRTGAPSTGDMKELCALGITEMGVLSGDAEKVEVKKAAACPTLQVAFDIDQSARKPLTESFLAAFDNWVAESRATGKKIAFRCSCGCHRTGRLAAYYQMKYQGYTVAQAIAMMNKLGKYMWLHPQLKPQVQALHDFIHGRTCSTKSKYCVSK